MKYSTYDIQGTDWIEQLSGCTISDQEVWDIAREYNEEPNIENILIGLRFAYLRDYVLSNYPVIKDIDWYINCADSHFYIMDENGDTQEVSSENEIAEINDQIEQAK